ncbi:thiamine-phosphate kinase [Photobacterium leiognathi subsp. mandapamensis]|uniref:thiamine-phosphate kinase n=1 Tax=Photobacterium leiognathi TaxID=553611 RepID=UPI000D162187|nr:thiamine-phosphate kinase [Photobacterium leiognathi]PSW65754.1 thiamine-phosphate kinase [Photobacterium leiognathi subsp. mandapamensis]
MAQGEFDLIGRYFEHQKINRSDVDLAIGDDCALLRVPEGHQLAISTDSLVAGTHFLVDADPKLVAHKALASNLSDLAAMGATPAWVSLALTLPSFDEQWLSAFCEGFFKLAEQYNVQLIGGDTTKGPLSITLTVQGFVPVGQALTRSGASSTDAIYVTGQLGDSAAGLALLLKDKQCDNTVLSQALMTRHFMTMPQVEAGTLLRGKASAALDISDGLIADLGHILKRSNVGAEIYTEALPISAELAAFCETPEQAQQMALSSGEEYQLCFTVPVEQCDDVEALMAKQGIQISRIGQLTENKGIVLLNNGKPVNWQLSGWDHFESESK